jgi:hypothetical protein
MLGGVKIIFKDPGRSEMESNGRISWEDRKSAPGSSALPGFDYPTTGAATAGTDAIRGNLMATPLNTAFFSPDNLQIIQNQIRYKVWDKTKHTIDPQSSDDLLIVMRSMYYQYGKNRPDHIKEQIEELNKIVADWCVPKILAEIDMYLYYRKDVSKLPVPLEHPMLQTLAGTRSLPFPKFF